MFAHVGIQCGSEHNSKLFQCRSGYGGQLFQCSMDMVASYSNVVWIQWQVIPMQFGYGGKLFQCTSQVWIWWTVIPMQYGYSGQLFQHMSNSSNQRCYRSTSSILTLIQIHTNVACLSVLCYSDKSQLHLPNSSHSHCHCMSMST